MTSRWALALLPAGGALLTAAALLALGEAAGPRVYVLQNTVALGAAAVGCAVGARAFAPGDHMRRAWALSAVCYGLLVAGTLLFGASSNTEVRDSAAWATLAMGVITVAANAASVVGTWQMARAWSVAGLDVLTPRRTRVAAQVVCTALALGLAGGNAWSAARDLFMGNAGGLENLASSLGDMTCLALIAPVALTAFSLRGGALAWPWTLLAVSQVGWLLFDGVLLLGSLLQASDGALRPLEEGFRMVACLGALSAGLLQRDVLALGGGAAGEGAPTAPGLAGAPVAQP